MKRFISVFLRIIVILLAMSFNIVENILHQVSALTYSMTAEFTVTTILVIVTAALFALSVIKFKLTGRLEKIIMCFLLAAAVITIVLLFGYYGIMYIAVFVCSAYTMELILSK